MINLTDTTDGYGCVCVLCSLAAILPFPRLSLTHTFPFTLGWKLSLALLPLYLATAG